ncbi:MAG: hypothetical protein LBJ67_03345 [Planctomycetaceae bacterium]|jgi:hypothetical protein|nr:hypothetical protein [Planctomycetaceae bacterium]
MNISELVKIDGCAEKLLGTSKNLSQIFVSPYFSTVTFVENEVFRSFLLIILLLGEFFRSSLKYFALTCILVVLYFY